MAGKGSKRRPQRIPKEEFDRRWDEIFLKNVNPKKAPPQTGKTKY